MILVKIASEKEKRGVLENKEELRGGDIWIEKDLTWKERTGKWLLKQIARRDMSEGRKV